MERRLIDGDRELLDSLCERAGVPTVLNALAERCAFEALGANRNREPYERAVHALYDLARTLR